MDHVMAGLEDISGMMMGNYKLRDKFRYYNNRYLRKWLLRDSKEMGNSSRKIFETCSRLDLRDAMTLVSKQHFLATTAAAAMNGNAGAKLTFAAYANANYVNDEDENGNNCKDEQNMAGQGPGIPKIFLTVPGNPALATSGVPLMMSPNHTLASLFRTFTQSNLADLNNIEHYPDSNNELSLEETLKNGDGSDFNYDIGRMVYSPSLKDLKDAEFHHILNDAMFKPFKKAHHYTRSDYYEEPAVHPPFQHHVRMQIRKLFSEKQKLENQRRHSHNPYHYQYSRNNNLQESTRDELLENGKNNNTLNDDKTSCEQIELVSKPKLERDKSNDSENDDQGITFVAQKHQDNCDSSSEKNNKKVMDQNFPWYRSSSARASSNELEYQTNNSITSISSQELSKRIESNESKDVVRQQEFPLWINNRDYVDAYTSPTSTLINRIDLLGNFLPQLNKFSRSSSSSETKPQDYRNKKDKNNDHLTKRVPSVYEIFQIPKIDDNKNNANEDNEKSQNLPEQSRTTSKNTFGSNDTVIEFLPNSSNSSNSNNDKEKLSDNQIKSIPGDNDCSLVISKL